MTKESTLKRFRVDISIWRTVIFHSKSFLDLKIGHPTQIAFESIIGMCTLLI